jgi:hypothetical protein
MRLPPRHGFDAAGALGHFRHGTGGDEIVLIQIKQTARDEHRAVVLTGCDELLHLLFEMLRAPAAVAAVAAVAERAEKNDCASDAPSAGGNRAARARARCRCSRYFRKFAR